MNKMITHELVQGTPEWHAYRANHFNASDAPVMMGVSKYKTRTQLLNELKTGIVPDVNTATQKLFDDGHKFEALARPVAEQIIGHELSPVTGSRGKLSASFDGLTLMGDMAFEHKTLNDAIRACQTIDDLDEMYLVQMEQQLLVSGAEVCMFLATLWQKTEEITEHSILLEDGTIEYYNLLESKELWYAPNRIRRQAIIHGWTQFERDLQDHTPLVIAEKPVAQALMALPTLVIRSGSALVSNLPEVADAVTKFIGNMIRDPKTDEDFVNMEAQAKLARETAKKLVAAMDNEFARSVTFLVESLDNAALQAEKDVKAKKEAIKLHTLNIAQEAFNRHVSAITLPVRFNPAQPKFAEAIKGLRSITSLHGKINDALALAKIDADVLARELQAKHDWFQATASDTLFLFNDLDTIIYKAKDDFESLVKSRIADYKNSQIKEAENLALARKASAVQAEQLVTVDKTVAPASRIVTGFIEPIVKIHHFDGVKPDAEALVYAVAEYFGADPMQAHNWLLNTDFLQFKFRTEKAA